MTPPGASFPRREFSGILLPMVGIAVLIVGAFLFAVIGVIALLVKSSGQGELLREYERRISLLEEGLKLLGSTGDRAEMPPATEGPSFQGRDSPFPETEIPETAADAAEGPSSEGISWVPRGSAWVPPPELTIPDVAESPPAYPPGDDGPPEAAAQELLFEDEVLNTPPEEGVLEGVEAAAPETADADGSPDRAGPRNPLAAFIRGGNLWVAGGIVLLLAGFATLITYLAGRGFFTVEMGIAGAALSGLLMLILGWGFRKKRPLYFLLLQGGGVGILYLSVFAAYKLTPFFPSPVSLILMSFLVLPAVVLALFQNSQALALLGFLGGFAAPLLIGGGGGNHVFLFAYYLVLDLGVLGIAFFRRWGLLNLLALLCSFILANLWTLNSYRPEYFRSAEPFFLAYIVLFTLLSLRGFETEQNRGFDAALALGTPVLGAPIQWRVFEFLDHGHALISLAFSAFYILLAFIVWKRWKKNGKGWRIFCEVCLGFGVLLANLAAPLELAPRITGAVWAAEALAVFLLGLRLEKRRIVAAALVLHIAAAIAFLVEQNPPFLQEAVFQSPRFAGSLVIALSALAMAYVSRHPRFSPPSFYIPRSALSLALGIWAYAWWFGGWFGEIYRGLPHPSEIFFLVCSATALGAYGASRFLRSPVFRVGMIPSFAFGVFLFLRFFIVSFGEYDWELWMSRNYFDGLYLWAWLAFFLVQSLLIFLTRREPQKVLHGIWALIFIFMGLEMVSASGRALTLSYDLAPAWTSFAGLLPVFTAMIVVSFLGRRLPAYRETSETGEGLRGRLFFYVLPLVLSCVLGIWFIVSLFLSGDPAPLPFYIPLINPLDLEEAFCVVLFLLWQTSLQKRGDLPVLKKRTLFISIDIMMFLFAMALCARSVHFYGGVPYRRLIYSDVFHLCIFILWAVYGIGHVIAGNKLLLRRLWIAGAVLMVGDIAKFILLDLANAGTAPRVVSFFFSGLLLLFIGWAAPLPPSAKERNEVPQPHEES